MQAGIDARAPLFSRRMRWTPALRLSFHGMTEYLRGLVSVYERPITAGVQLLMVYSTASSNRRQTFENKKKTSFYKLMNNEQRLQTLKIV